MMHTKSMGIVLVFASLLLHADDSISVLGRILAEKGVITQADLARLSSEKPEDRMSVLVAMLRDKNVLSGADIARIREASGQPVPAENAVLVPAVYSPAVPASPVQAPSAQRTVETPPPAPPVVTASKFGATLYGTLLVNSFYDTGLTNNQDIPLFFAKQGSDPLGNDKSFGMTARQSRLGMRFQGPTVMGAKTSGQVEVDFFGGKSALANGISFDLLRLRLALGRLDWQNFSLVTGQDWSIFAPLNPTSLASYSIPALAASGNPWIRAPQIRFEARHAFSDTSKLQWQIAATDPNAGDYPTASFLTARTPSIGERGRFPGIESRLGLTTTAEGRDFAVGLSSHYSRGKNAGAIGNRNIQTGVDSWGVALDYSLPFTKYFNLTGEAYGGRELGIYSVAFGEAVLPVGTVGQHGVFSRGGWMQAQFNLDTQWQVNLSYGIDAPRANELPVGNRNRNQTYIGNVMYKLSPYITFAAEYRRFLTDFRNQLFANERGDHVNLAIAYSF